MTHGAWPALLHQYGCLLVFLLIGLEAAGLPLPGEAVMIAAAIYAARTQQLSIGGVLASACGGAVLGSVAGYLVGRSLGTRLLARFGPRVGMGPDRQLLAQYLMQRHGAWMVVFGRFIAVLRTLAAVLAGASRMGFGRFMLANVLGAVGWTGLYCLAAYSFGDAVRHVAGRAAVAIGVVAVIAAVAGIGFIRRHERQLLAQARQARDAGLLAG